MIVHKNESVWENDAAEGVFFAKYHWPPREFLAAVANLCGADAIEGVSTDAVEMIYLRSTGNVMGDEVFAQCRSSDPHAQPYTTVDLS